MGSARIADEKDIKGMGLWDGWIIVLGRFKKRLVKLPESLSVFVRCAAWNGENGWGGGADHFDL
jgi:hypothetical protein